MSSVIYAIVFNGQIVESFQLISVKAHMAKMLKVDADKMAVLFSGKQVVLKRTADKQAALKYAHALKKVGADVRVRAIKTDGAAAPAPSEAPAKPAAAVDAASGLSLAPAGGNLTEPKPPPPRAEIDTSGLEVLPNDGTPLAPSKPPDAIELDLTEYSLSDMDGSPLIEPAPPPPKIEAPDFELDEPGATLETHKDNPPPVEPDTSGLSLAEVGEDLLTPAEKPHEAPPGVPDISNLELLPNPD